MAEEWVEGLHKKEVREFSFYPQAYTPMEKGFELPEVEMEFDGGDDSDSSKDSTTQSNVPTWVKNLSFTVGGVTLGAAAVYSLVGGGAPVAAPACPVAVVQNVQSPAAAPVKPSGTPPKSTGGAAGAPAASSTQHAQSSAGAATSSSADGTI